MCMIGIAYTFEDTETQGMFITTIVGFKLLFNFFLILKGMFDSLKRYLRRKCLSKKAKVKTDKETSVSPKKLSISKPNNGKLDDFGQQVNVDFIILLLIGQY